MERETRGQQRQDDVDADAREAGASHGVPSLRSDVAANALDRRDIAGDIS